MENMDIVVVINSFNRLTLLKDSITSLCAEMNKSALGFAIVIYDAGSSDGSIDWIKEFSKNYSNTIYLIDASSDADTSFSHGVNTACDFAIEKFNSFNYFLLYETDNYIKSFRSIKASISLLEKHQEIAACGYTVKKHDGSNAGFGSSFPNLFSFVLGQQLSFFLKVNEPSVKWLSFQENHFSYADVVYTSPLLIKKESWIDVNGLDEYHFPFSDCDIDLAYRLALKGKRMAVIQTSDIIHDNRQVSSLWSSTRTINYYKARYRYFRKHYGVGINLLKPLLMTMHLLEMGMIICLYIIGKRDFGSIKTRWFLVKGVFRNYSLKS
jgi:GT2 family glycosyltransferase